MTRPLRGAAYFIAIATIFVQLSEVLLRLWPFHFNSAAWRLSFVSSATGIVLTLLLMTFLLIGIAGFAGDRVISLVFSGFAILAAIAFFGLTGMFVLDAIQMRNQIQATVLRQYDVTSVWTLTRTLIGFAGFTMLAVGGLRSGIAMRRQTARQTHRNSGPLMVANAAGKNVGSTPLMSQRVSGESAGVKGG